MGMMMRKELIRNDIVEHDWNNSDEEEFVGVKRWIVVLEKLTSRKQKIDY